MLTLLLQRRTAGTDGGQEDGEKDQAVEDSVTDRQAEYLEEGQEDVGGGEGEDDDREEGGHPGIGYGWAEIHQGFLGLLESGSCTGEKRVERRFLIKVPGATEKA